MGSWDSYTTGQRLKILRGERTQENVAEGMGVSVQTVRKAEQNQGLSLPTLMRFSAELHADVSVILGQQAPRRAMSAGDRAALRDLSIAVHDTAAGALIDPAEEQAPSGDELERAMAQLWRIYWDGDYTQTAVLAAPLVRSAALYRHAAAADRQAHADGIMSDAYRAASLAANFLGSRDLAYAAVGHSLHHARKASDPVRLTMLATTQARILLRDARVTDAQQVAEQAAHAAEPRVSDRDPAAWVAFGKAVVFGAVAASRLGDNDGAADLLSEAHAAAARLGRDVMLNGLQFGPSYATHQAIGVHVALGNSTQALTLAEQFRDRSGLSHAAQSRVGLDVAVALCDTEQWDEALDILLTVVDDNPDWTRHQALSGVIMQRAGRGSSSRLRRAAAMLKMPAVGAVN